MGVPQGVARRRLFLPPQSSVLIAKFVALCGWLGTNFAI
jgi:hypothetical protein